jgi:hypothetical protein
MSDQGQQFQVIIRLGKEPCVMFQRIRLKRWMEMTGKQGVFEMTERNDFGSEASF